MVDEAQTREYIKTVSGWVENGTKALASAQRWPWKRGDVQRLLYETAHNLVVLGINECLIGEVDQARSDFRRAADFFSQRFHAVDSIFLGYHDLQVIAAAAVADAWDDAAAVARGALAKSAGTHADATVAGPNAAVRAVLGWLLQDRELVASESAKAASPLDQFTLWAELAALATEKDDAGFAKSFEKLVSFVRREVRSGDFRYSEDRFAYLPGQLLLLLARRDALPVTAPADEWWRICGTPV